MGLGLMNKPGNVTLYNQRSVEQGNIKHSSTEEHGLWEKCLRILKVRRHGSPLRIARQTRSVPPWFWIPARSSLLRSYVRIIKHPIDLKTVHLKVAHRLYNNPFEFCEDVRLIWNNCRKCNRIGKAVRTAADLLSESFERGWECSQIEICIAKKM